MDVKNWFHKGKLSLNAEDCWMRHALNKDIPRLRKLVNTCYEKLAECGMNYTGATQNEALTKQRLDESPAFILGSGEQWIGTISLYENIGPTGHRCLGISQLGVVPSEQHYGYGEVLMRFAHQAAMELGFDFLLLDTALPAHHLVAFYEKRGFVKVGEVQWPEKTYRSGFFEKVVDRSKHHTLNWDHRILGANYFHAKSLAHLCTELGYPSSEEEMNSRLDFHLNDHSNARCFVVERFNLESQSSRTKESQVGHVSKCKVQVCGFLTAEKRHLIHCTPFMEVGSLVVSKSHRNSGIGGQLLACAEEWASDLGLEKVLLRSNVSRFHAHAFYENKGYKKQSQSFKFSKDIPLPNLISEHY